MPHLRRNAAAIAVRVTVSAALELFSPPPLQACCSPHHFFCWCHHHLPSPYTSLLDSATRDYLLLLSAEDCLRVGAPIIPKTFFIMSRSKEPSSPPRSSTQFFARAISSLLSGSVNLSRPCCDQTHNTNETTVRECVWSSLSAHWTSTGYGMVAIPIRGQLN